MGGPGAVLQTCRARLQRAPFSWTAVGIPPPSLPGAHGCASPRVGGAMENSEKSSELNLHGQLGITRMRVGHSR